MKRKMNVPLAASLVISLFSLGGCSAKDGGTEQNQNPYTGKWIAVSAEMMGISVSVEDMFEDGFSFDIENGNQIVFNADGTKGQGTYKVQDDEISIALEGEEIEGTIGDDTITFDGLMGEEGIKVIFAKEGTEAANPALYLSDEEKAFIGNWMSDGVEELLEDEMSTTMDGVDDIHDALRLEFNANKEVTVVYKKEELGTYAWYAFSDTAGIECETPSILVGVNEDGTLNVDYSDDENYYTFHMVKAE